MTKIKEVLLDFCKKTSIQGIPNIYQAKSLSLKTIWILFFILATSGSSYLVIKSISNYLDFEVVTKIRVIRQQPAEFPTITICNLNRLSTINDKEIYDQYHEIFQNFSYIDKQFYFPIITYNLSQKTNNSLGFKLKELITECFFGQFECNYDDDFVQVYYYSYGKCFRFNSGSNSSGHKIEPKTINDQGFMYGLKLNVFTGFPEFSFLKESSGLFLVIHNSTVNPSINEGFKVSTGLETNIAVNRVFTYKKEKPYSECVLDADTKYPDFMIPYFKDSNQIKYFQEECIYLCYQSIVISQIGCFDPDFDKLNSTQPCSSVDDVYKYKNLDNIATDLYQECKSKCPVQCDSLEYNYFISQTNLPNSLDKDTSEFNSSKIDSYKNSHLSLNIYYNSFYYTVIEEVVKIDIIDLVSGIGGTIGLFIGCSVLSIAEIFELIFLLIDALLKREKVLAFDNQPPQP